MNSMLSQVHSLPGLIRESIDAFDDAVRRTFDHSLCLSLKRLILTGCGDSHHAALGSEMAFERLAGVPTEPMTAMQFARYAAGSLPDTGPGTNVVVGISVSGEVSRTLEALNMARQMGATTVALTATLESRAARAAEHALLSAAAPFPDPPGVHTPGVRSYAANQLMLYLLAVRLAEVRGKIVSADAAAIRGELRALAEAAERTIAACDPLAQSLAGEFGDAQEFVFVGAGPNFGTALFSAAKVLEASGDAALGQEPEEWAHLQYFARSVDTPTFFISAGQRDLSRAVEAAVAAKAIGRRVVAVAPASAKTLAEVADRTLPLADGWREMFSPLIAGIPGELFAAHRSDAVGEPFFRSFGGGRSQENGGGISRIRTSEMWETIQS
jgi:glucosamine--fructose-6-phosphate aminotransferase (isomerizing)